MEHGTRTRIYPLAMTAVMAAVMGVVAPFSVAIGPVPLSFCTLAIYLSACLLGWRRATLATLAYILLGAVGMPVFSGFSAGLGVLAGPTGGYVVGYLPLAALAGLAAARFPRSRPLQLLGMAGATAVLYALGTAWYCLQSGGGPGARPGRLRPPLPARRPAEDAGRHGGGPRPPGPAGPGGYRPGGLTGPRGSGTAPPTHSPPFRRAFSLFSCFMGKIAL